MDSPEVDSFQVEIIKQGEPSLVDLLVSTIRGARGKRKLHGEAIVSDWCTPIIQFEVQHAKDIDDLRDRFIRQLVHRGYMPKRYRERVKGKLTDWREINPENYDFSPLAAATAPAEFSE